jgi:hypothetical protein
MAYMCVCVSLPMTSLPRYTIIKTFYGTKYLQNNTSGTRKREQYKPWAECNIVQEIQELEGNIYQFNFTENDASVCTTPGLVAFEFITIYTRILVPVAVCGPLNCAVPSLDSNQRNVM